ncbi:NAD+ diphosphatase [Clostridium acidisoli DSM 12555]|uniref:NAD(+) diphosphatase n=1 Tax=Clostridium acidisoli DSM 12555 TaxID=1121291 RepID=A0A1W1XZW1_9CLOT|nr:NUDIX domain-containing protein [Clostridium acidisoli]SMC29456.1 NAD+ diphosphatase [Clostridium acidisoli DSM 12555]
MKFIYCPICGGRLEEKYSYDEGGVPYCPIDDIMYFDTPKPCIIVAVVKDNKMLLMLRQNYTFKDSKVLVSGYVSNGEEVEETVLREVKEETGIIAKDPKYLGSYYLKAKEIVMLTFMAKYEAGEIISSEEVDWAGWTNIENAIDEMGEDTIGKSVVKMVLEEIKNVRN